MNSRETGVREVHHRGEPALRLETADGASATVLLHGAHVVSWQPAPGDERLYLSDTTRFGPGAAIRGGVPVIFPRFALTQTNAAVPRHGFARTLAWRRAPGTAPATPDVCAALELGDDASTLALWPARFRLALAVTLSSRRLTLSLAVLNRGDAAFDFTAALHTYLAVDDIAATTVTGLDGLAFEDKVAARHDVQSGPALRFDAETDRVYAGVRETIVLRDARRALAIDQRGFEDAVVWNPWAQRCADLPDMPDDDYRRMVCIEAAQVVTPVRLAAGGRWVGEQALSVTR